MGPEVGGRLGGSVQIRAPRSCCGHQYIWVVFSALSSGA